MAKLIRLPKDPVALCLLQCGCSRRNSWGNGATASVLPYSGGYLAPTMALQNQKLLGTTSRIPKVSLKSSERFAGSWHIFLWKSHHFAPKVHVQLINIQRPSLHGVDFQDQMANGFPAQSVCNTRCSSIAAWGAAASLCPESSGSKTRGESKTGDHLEIFKQVF